MYLKFGKPLFDWIISLFGLLLLSPFLILISILLFFIHKSSPFFLQTRVGQHARRFKIYKFKTLLNSGQSHWFLKVLRKTKMDELPQLINVLKGEMSLVGPRPDIPGYYDRLEDEYRLILELRPGITGYASIAFANEEQVLSEEQNPLYYNDEVIFPEKVKLNLDYYRHVSFWLDLKILFKTILLPLNL